jgi:hypothetical protein
MMEVNASLNNITTATVIILSHEAENSLAANAHRIMATVITTWVFINIMP